MIKPVFDTVILVRSLIKPRGYNSEIIKRVNEYELFVSEDILDILSEAEVIAPSQKFNLCRDPHDNKFIECAFAADADYIVSGDEDLLAIKEYGKIKIVTADAFLRILDNLSPK
jgi:predicted nucleic acid-binding protein